MISENARKWWILSAMCLLTVMLNLDVTGINLAIPIIAHEFHASLASMQWVINAYVLLAAMFQIFGGRLGDTYGYKKIYLIGTALFVLASAGAGLSLDEGMLITFRVIQGFALGIAYPMTIVLTFAAFPKKQQGFALSFIVATMGVSLGIGPPLGGFFVDYIGWRWIFYINVPFGIAAFVIAYIFCSPHKAKDAPSIDYVGTLFLSLGLFGILLAVNQVQVWGLESVAFWVTLGIGVLFLLTLYFIEKKISFPIMNFQFFKIRNFLFNNILRLISQLVFVSALFFFPLYLINISGYSSLYSGLLLLFLTVVIAISSPIVGKWVDRVGDKIPNLTSMILFTLSYILFYFLETVPNLILLGVGLVLLGVATGITFVSTVTGSVSVVPEKDKGVATGVIFTTAWFGCGAGVATMGAIIALSSKAYLMEQLSQIKLSFSSTQIDLLTRVSKGIASYKNLPKIFSTDSIDQVTQIAREAFIHGLHTCALVWIAISIIGIVLSLCLKKHSPQHHS